MYKKKKTGRKKKAPSKSEFEYKYYVLNQDAKILATEYGVKVQTVYNWASEYRKQEKEN